VWHTIVRHRITSKGQNYLADHVLWRSITLRGQACQLTEGEACSAQGGPASRQWLPVCHVRSHVPVKDKTLRPYQNTSLVMRSVASTAQSRVCKWLLIAPTLFVPAFRLSTVGLSTAFPVASACRLYGTIYLHTLPPHHRSLHLSKKQQLNMY